MLLAHRPLLMGILNVTPDSFSDGGLHLDARAAVDRGMKMLDEGADLIDVGGESTRPGAEPVSEQEEARRVLPVIEALASRGIAVSVDTMKSTVARDALSAGARIVNDVTALRDPRMADVCAQAHCTVCLMHMQGEPRTMQAAPTYNDVVAEVGAFLRQRADDACAHGIAANRIWVDPGIGFGKTTGHNLALIGNLRQLAGIGYPLLVGVSRKAFIGKILGSPDAPLPTHERLEGTLAVQVLAQAMGARVIRAHDVLASRRAIDVAAAVLSQTDCTIGL